MGLFTKYLKKSEEVKVEERIPARCSVTKEIYDILLGHENGKLTMFRGERSYSEDMSISTRGGTRAGFKKIAV